MTIFTPYCNSFFNSYARLIAVGSVHCIYLVLYEGKEKSIITNT